MELKHYIIEAFKISKNTKIKKYNYFPKTKDELKELLEQLIEERGNKGDFNDIDTSEIIDMSELFYWTPFNGDISKWNVSNVKDMANMFAWCESFNQPLNEWDVSNVKKYNSIFDHCPIEEKYKPKFK